MSRFRALAVPNKEMSSRSAQPTAALLPMPARELSDSMLVARALTRDRWAEEAIFRRHVGYLNGVCLRLLRDPEEARDVVQDTFVDVLEQLPALRDPEQLRRWMTGIAVHKIHKRFRRRRLLSMLGLQRSSDQELATLPAHASVSPELCAELVRLDRVLDTVPEDARACWLLRYVEGYRLEEVAELCACSLATVKRRIARTHQRVRAHVQLGEVAE